jgi:hypothetical protein
MQNSQKRVGFGSISYAGWYRLNRFGILCNN